MVRAHAELSSYPGPLVPNHSQPPRCRRVTGTRSGSASGNPLFPTIEDTAEKRAKNARIVVLRDEGAGDRVARSCFFGLRKDGRVPRGSRFGGGVLRPVSGLAEGNRERVGWKTQDRKST